MVFTRRCRYPRLAGAPFDHAARAVPAGPIIGFEARMPQSSALAELRSGLDESWRAAPMTARFDRFGLHDDSRAAWLGYVVARSLEASPTWPVSASCHSRIISAA